MLLLHMAASAFCPSLFKETAGDLEQVREGRFPVKE